VVDKRSYGAVRAMRKPMLIAMGDPSSRQSALHTLALA
jgi:hypothetical protein